MSITNKIQKIKKRDGRIVPFDQQRITNAVHKAFMATREEDGKIAKKISDKTVRILNAEFKPSQIPTVEQIQDIAIKAIGDSGYKDVAEAYLDYRKKRDFLTSAFHNRDLHLISPLSRRHRHEWKLFF